MDKIDLRKQLKHLYAPSAKKVEVVEVPEFQFAMIDGRIEPGAEPATSTDFRAALEALYGISYTLKFMSKQRPENPIDYGVMALEGLWWTAGGNFDIARKDDWRFTLMMMQPDHITGAMYGEALAKARAKRESPAWEKMRLEHFAEGLCVQIMHVGPYADEPATIARLHAFAQENGYALRGHHHEIYLGDPRLAKPENLKTVLRQPVARVG
jgi:hypothetical protein